MISKVSGEITNLIKSRILTYPYGKYYGDLKDMLRWGYTAQESNYNGMLRNAARSLDYYADPRRLRMFTTPYEKMSWDMYDASLKDIANKLKNNTISTLDAQTFAKNNKEYHMMLGKLIERMDLPYKKQNKILKEIVDTYKVPVKDIADRYDKAFEITHKGFEDAAKNAAIAAKDKAAKALELAKHKSDNTKELLKKQLDNWADIEKTDLKHRADLRQLLAKEPHYKSPMDWLAKNWQPVAAGGATAAALGAAGWNLHNAINEDKSSQYMYE